MHTSAKISNENKQQEWEWKKSTRLRGDKQPKYNKKCEPIEEKKYLKQTKSIQKINKLTK